MSSSHDRLTTQPSPDSSMCVVNNNNKHAAQVGPARHLGKRVAWTRCKFSAIVQQVHSEPVIPIHVLSRFTTRKQNAVLLVKISTPATVGEILIQLRMEKDCVTENQIFTSLRGLEAVTPRSRRSSQRCWRRETLPRPSPHGKPRKISNMPLNLTIREGACKFQACTPFFPSPNELVGRKTSQNSLANGLVCQREHYSARFGQSERTIPAQSFVLNAGNLSQCHGESTQGALTD